MITEKIEEIEKICRELNVSMRRGQRMSNHTALAVGGEIDAILYPESRAETALLIERLNKLELDWRPLGGGTRVLVKDEPIHTIAINLKLMEELLSFDGALVQAHGGYRMARLADAAMARGLSGLESFIGHPGTLGGAVRAHAIKLLIEKISLARDGKVIELNRRQLKDYRGEMILGAVLRLRAGKLKKLPRRPLNQWPIGSGPIFHNVQGRSPAAIIKKAGLAHAKHGGAMLALWDANFIVCQEARADDVITLIDLVRAHVRMETEIELKPALEIWPDVFI